MKKELKPEVDTQNEIELKRSELGEKLKDIRIMKNYDLKAIADSMRVSSQNLTDIEDGIEFNKKNQYIARLVTLKYIEHLDCDDFDIINLVNIVYPNFASRNIENKTNIDVDFGKGIKKSKIKDIKQYISFLIAFLFLITLIGVSVYYMYNYMTDLKVESTVVNESTLLKDTKLEAKSIIEPEKVDEIIFDKNVDNQYYYNITKLTDPSNYEIKIEFTGDCWLMVSDFETGEEIGNSNVSKTSGDVETYSISDIEQVEINLGAVQNAKVYVNGVELDMSVIDSTGPNLVYLINESE